MSAEATLLIVDDDDAVRTLLSRRLTGYGYRCVEVSSGAAALERANLGNVDLILLDLMMPEMTGFEVLELLRKKHGFTELPIIVMSARDDGDSVLETLKLGANDYTIKPIDFPTLLKRVDVHLRLQRGIGMKIGPYVLDERIGGAKMGGVYRAKDTRTNAVVALKVLSRADTIAPQFRQRFAAEAALLGRIDHPNVVRFHDAANDGETHYLAMELVDGPSLEEIVSTQGPRSLSEVVRMGLELGAALQAIHHENILHRDVKPANVIPNEAGTLKLADFGIARDLAATRVTARGVGVGSLEYAPPEQLDGEATTTSDVYALGCTLWFAATAEDPFPNHLSVLELQARKLRGPLRTRGRKTQLPGALAGELRRMTHPDPANRPTIENVLTNFAKLEENPNAGGLLAKLFGLAR